MPFRIPESLQSLRRRLFLRSAHRLGLPVREGNAVSLLAGGDAILAATLALIRGAKTDLHCEMFIWARDSVGEEIAEAIHEALARGVAVRGVVDAVGSWGSGGLVSKLKEAGADLRWYHPVATWRPRLWNQRNHRKLVIADGVEAVVASGNWGLDYSPKENAHAFLDLGIALRGPSVADLVEDFATVWSRVEGAPFVAVAAATDETPLSTGPWQEAATVQVVSSVARGGRQILRRHLFMLLSQVQRELLVANAYFVPGRPLMNRLAHLARHGRRVVLLLPGQNNHPFVQAASRYAYAHLLRNGVRILERERTMLHAKAALFDDEAVLIGSANLDPRSFRLNLELNLLVRQGELVAQARALFDQQAPLSEEMDSSAWSRRPWRARAWSWFAYQFRRWL